ncbi:hypothetical protein DSL72_004812 [Monilinia vaccinii-corymbosi]|uniref:FAD-binding PCMH-type domain-containing protein n=1 Tax=Monilinia vaccinii-corymbosi TaxID=61207 RepID=A0A8A3P1G4_9HELO|nr:hypothetical protein DSL72_004812 [Monilinia vaccinii-corymbosi]
MMLPIFSLLFTIASATALSSRQQVSATDVCEQIRGKITGEVTFGLTSLSKIFDSKISHYMRSSSSETPTCVVEVASDEDVSIVMQIISKTKTPFAVKCGGHTSNPGFSSTTGVFILLARLDQVKVSNDKSTVEIGTGLRWVDVYDALDGTGVNVVGGRVSGPGVGGFTLGGGYSWFTNQYGLACDTIISFTLVLPDGTITKVDSTKPDLFFALKGGLNRFGVVTSIVFKTVPQAHQVYGGVKYYEADSIPDIITATTKFQQENTDPKAQVILTINGGIVPNAILIAFYDGPDRPSAFDPFDKVGGALPFVSHFKTQPFASFVKVTPSNLQAGHRGAFHTMMTTGLTPGFLNAVYNESKVYGKQAVKHSATFLSYQVEPFGKYGQYATDSAFPHADSPLPLNLYFSWELSSEDAFWRGVMQRSIDHLTEVAKAEGIYSSAPAYPNYALSTYRGDQIYGPTNAARLRKIQDQYDPDRVMLLAGGFDI